MSVLNKYLKLIKNGKMSEIEIRYFRKTINGSSTLQPHEIHHLINELNVRIVTKGIKITKEQTEKGINWLIKTAFKLNGGSRKSSPFGSFEESVIKNFKKFEFSGVYNVSDNNYRNYMPVYKVISKNGDWFEYVAYSFGQITVLNISS